MNGTSAPNRFETAAISGSSVLTMIRESDRLSRAASIV